MKVFLNFNDGKKSELVKELEILHLIKVLIHLFAL